MAQDETVLLCMALQVLCSLEVFSGHDSGLLLGKILMDVWYTLSPLPECEGLEERDIQSSICVLSSTYCVPGSVRHQGVIEAEMPRGFRLFCHPCCPWVYHTGLLAVLQLKC